MRTRLGELGIYTSATHMEIAVVEFHTESHIRTVLGTEVDAAHLYSILVAITRSHIRLTGSRDIIGIILGSDALIILIIIAHQGKTILTGKEASILHPSGMLQRQVVVVALLRLQIRITVNHLHTCHIKVHIHLLERWGTESAGIVGTDGETLPLGHQSQTTGSSMLDGCREVIMTKTCHDVQPLQRIVIELGEGIT